MPEGPSPYILKEQTARFVGKIIVRAGSNSSAFNTERLSRGFADGGMLNFYACSVIE